MKKKSVEVMRLLGAQANAFAQGDDKEATYIQQTLNNVYGDFWCTNCPHKAARHTLTLEAAAWNPDTAIRKPCAGEQMHDGEEGEPCDCPGLRMGRVAQPVTIRRVIGERPADWAAGWFVFNAPRPLPGTKHWQGDWCHGIFYSGVNPADPYAGDWIEGSADLDGWLIRHVSMEDVRQWAYIYADESGYITREDMDKADEEEIANLYLSHRGLVKGEIVGDAITTYRVVEMDIIKDLVAAAKASLVRGEHGQSLKLMQSLVHELPARAEYHGKQALRCLEVDEDIEADAHLVAVLERIGEVILK